MIGRTKRSKEEVLLFKAVSALEFTMGMPKFTTGSEKYINEIVEGKYYDELVTASLIRYEIFLTLSSHFGTFRKEEDLSKPNLPEAVKVLHQTLSAIPAVYTFWFRMPLNYPIAKKNLMPNLEIQRLDEVGVQQFEKANPASSLSIITSRNKDFVLKANVTYMCITAEGSVGMEGPILKSLHDPLKLFRTYIILQHLFKTTTPQPSEPNTMAFCFQHLIHVRNIPTTIADSSPLARSMFVFNQSTGIKDAERVFVLLFQDSGSASDELRNRILNSLYWYFDYVNSNEPNLKVIYIVSAIDSLFPIEYPGDGSGQIIPTVRDIAPVIAEAVSVTEEGRKKLVQQLGKLYSWRNKIVHGREDLQRYRIHDKKKGDTLKTILFSIENNYEEYITRQIDRYVNSCKSMP